MKIFKGRLLKLPGENIVFNLVLQKAQCDEINDDESCEFLHFEIDKDVLNFELNAENFHEARCFYHESSAWYIIALPDISQGIITGEKITDDEWLINVSVTPTARTPGVTHATITYEGVFRKQI